MYSQELCYPTFSPITAIFQSPLLPVKFVTTDACVNDYTPLVIHFCGKVSEISPLTFETLICPKSNQHPSIPNSTSWYHIPPSHLDSNVDIVLNFALLIHYSINCLCEEHSFLPLGFISKLKWTTATTSYLIFLSLACHFFTVTC